MEDVVRDKKESGAKKYDNLLSELAGIKIGLVAAKVSGRNHVNDEHNVLAQLAVLKIALPSLRSDAYGKLKILTSGIQTAPLPPNQKIWRLLGSFLPQGLGGFV